MAMSSHKMVVPSSWATRTLLMRIRSLVVPFNAPPPHQTASLTHSAIDQPLVTGGGWRQTLSCKLLCSVVLWRCRGSRNIVWHDQWCSECRQRLAGLLLWVVDTWLLGRRRGAGHGRGKNLVLVVWVVVKDKNAPCLSLPPIYPFTQIQIITMSE